jgi:hypothetical protein
MLANSFRSIDNRPALETNVSVASGSWGTQSSLTNCQRSLVFRTLREKRDSIEHFPDRLLRHKIVAAIARS